MKKPVLAFYLVTTFLLFFSCHDFLENPQPTDQFPITQVFNTATDLESALVGAYDLLQGGNLLGANVPALADLMAYNAEGWFEEVSTLQMPTSHWVTEQLWTQGYKAINQVNALLEALPAVMARDASLLTADANRIEGEALFMRGILHFELVRLYALPYSEEFVDEMGIPLMLEAVLKKDDIRFPARATIKEVYDKVTEDLQKARDLLPESNSRGRATFFAATSYLARIAFQKRDYETAASLAGLLMERNDLFDLTKTPQAFFTDEGSHEEIWVVFASGANDPIVGGLSSVYNDAPTTASITDDLKANGYNALLSTSQMADIQHAGYQFIDLRCDPFDVLSDGNPLVLDTDSSRCNKYENTWTSGEDDAPNFRLAELILMRAEALVRINGINEESIGLLNQIRQRSMRVIDENGLLVSESDSLISVRAEDFPNADSLYTAIIRERRVELAFEGNYLHDLMRLKSDVKNGDNVYGFSADELRLPIPQRDIDTNPNLKQNPGY